MRLNRRVSLMRKRTKHLIQFHKSKTGNANQVINEFSSNIELRTIDIRFLKLTKSLLVYQGILENELIELKEELESIKTQINSKSISTK